MRVSKCLFYSTTDSSGSSKWMPWELGFKDGQNTRAAILPIQATTPTDFRGQEYLGIYPYAVQEKSQTGKDRIWIHRSSTVYVVFEDWLNGTEPTGGHSTTLSRCTELTFCGALVRPNECSVPLGD